MLVIIWQTAVLFILGYLEKAFPFSILNEKINFPLWQYCLGRFYKSKAINSTSSLINPVFGLQRLLFWLGFLHQLCKKT